MAAELSPPREVPARRGWRAWTDLATRPRRGPAPIGLDLGHEALRMVQMDLTGSGVRLRAAATVEYAQPRDELLARPAALHGLVRKARAGHAFHGRRVVTCMPPEQVRLALVSYRAPSNGEEGSAILEQARMRVEGTIEDWVVDYLPVSARGEGEGDRAALLVLARREAVLGHLELLRRAGLEVVALEVGPAAVRRLIAALHHGQEGFGGVLIVNCGQDKSYLTVMSGRRLVLDREVDCGERSLTAKLGRVLEVEPEVARTLLYQHGLSPPAGGSGTGVEPVAPEAVSATVTQILRPELGLLAEEVDKVLVYMAAQTHGAGVDRVYLMGGMARWPGAEAVLAQLLALPARILDPISGFDARQNAYSREDLGPVAGMAVAAGCALRGWAGDD